MRHPVGGASSRRKIESSGWNILSLKHLLDILVEISSRQQDITGLELVKVSELGMYIGDLAAHQQWVFFKSHEVMRSPRGVTVREENREEGHQGGVPEAFQGEEAGRRQGSEVD